jgi:hypothetical protein
VILQKLGYYFQRFFSSFIQKFIFTILRVFALSLPIVNDAAERNVKLIQDFINSSHDESLRQDLLLTVEFKRKSDAVNKASKKMKI